MVDFAHVDALVAGYHRRGGQPGLAYGIVAGGELVHAAGLGERHLGGAPPDAGTVFRIASMTKSFTASAILTLRDDGLLRLDDLAEEYVPELSDWPPVSPDAARISIRHLLTMTAGFPTDDPWGDRQQGLQLRAGHPVRVLQPRLRDPGSGHYCRHGHGLPGLRAAPAAEAAGHDAHRL
jgi:CubicO group peptidase (beta-lactamase class C family)